MSLTPGDKLGPYEILSAIGAGGMGEVYKARDTRLHRTVAIKTSKAEFSERFEREARAVAALNHPNICQIHDVGPNYLVMELVEGQEIRGPLPIETAVGYAKQILDALDAAHRAGITHRDLKPANILVTKQGIKLLDFGLAKHDAPLKQTDATLTKALTGEGQILGTLQYMSPEQLQAKSVDSRSDIFAFGCVLYELISGKRAWEGQSAASVIAAILERDPAPLQATPPLEKVIRKCLAKDPDDRWQTARDLADELRWITAEIARPSPAMPNLGVRRRGFGQWAVPSAVAVGLVLAAWAGLRIGSADLPAARAVVHFSALPSTGRINTFDISGDGKKVPGSAYDAIVRFDLVPKCILRFHNTSAQGFQPCRRFLRGWLIRKSD